jgi:hypothetical protein
VWLHCYGERFDDPAAGRPKGPPRLPKQHAPFTPAGGAIPGSPEPLPDTMQYDAANRQLRVGKGYVENVTPEIWAYEVSGKQVIWQWFSYRRRDRSRPSSATAAPRRRSTRSSRITGSPNTRPTSSTCSTSSAG